MIAFAHVAIKHHCTAFMTHPTTTPNIDREQLRKLLGSDASFYPDCLETNFPHVLLRIVARWESPDLANLLEHLLARPAPGRQGFPPEALAEIARIAAIHSARTGTAANADPNAERRKADHALLQEKIRKMRSGL